MHILPILICHPLTESVVCDSVVNKQVIYRRKYHKIMTMVVLGGKQLWSVRLYLMLKYLPYVCTSCSVYKVFHSGSYWLDN